MAAIRELLPRTWQAFLGRFDRLTDIQAAAIPEVCAGRDTLMASPTASGKTEAYAAPAAELILAARPGRALVLVVSPTRALANDLRRRLASPMLDLGVHFGRYTGEHKERQRGQLPEIAITTPEAFDSLLARRPRELRETRLIVLDEIHVLDGTPRGDQVRFLLHRLDGLCARRVQRVAVSATIDEPEQFAARYLREATVVQAGTGRRIAARAFEGSSPMDLCRHLDDLAQNGFRKILMFCNRRADVENYTSSLKGRTRFGDAILPHHGSLSRTIRERTERQFLDAPAAVAIATMTLEMGIDIGSIDYIMLTAPPSEVASTLQRIGRGGRRGDTNRAGYLVDSAGDRLWFRVLLTCGARGTLKSNPYAFRPGVIVQQVLVLCASAGWVDAERLEGLLPPDLRTALMPTTSGDILDHMHEAGLIERQPAGRYVLDEAWEARYTRGVLHSNISAEMTTEIVDRLTGDVVGSILAADAKKFQLGGQGRRAVLASGDRLLTDATGYAEPARFTSRGAPNLPLALGRSVLERVGVREGEIWQVTDASRTLLLHGLGTVGALLLSKLLSATHGGSFIQASSPFVCHTARPLSELPDCSGDVAQGFLRRQEDRLAGLCGMGPHHRHLPPELAQRALFAACNLDQLVNFLCSARLHGAEPEELLDWDAARTL